MRNLLILICFLPLFLSGCSDPDSTSSHNGDTASPAKDELAGYPEHPVSGTINGYKIVADRAQLENGILTIRQGNDFFADRKVTVFLFDQGAMAGRTIDGTGIGGQAPHVSVSWRENKEDNLPDTKSLATNYDLSLTFGKATEFGIPYGIRFRTDVLEKKTEVAGRGFVTYKELKIRNGKPDRSFSSFDTLEYIAMDYLRKQEGEADLGDVERFDGYYTSDDDEAGSLQKGYIAIEYKKPDTGIVIARLQMKKDTAGWQVFRRLDETELEEAHPFVADPSRSPTPRSSYYMEELTARFIEDEYNKQGLVPRFRTTDMRCNMIKGYEEGNCEYSFEIKKNEGKDCLIRNFHLKFGEAWRIVEEIDTGYRYDFDSGELVKDKYGSKLCRQEKN